MLKSRSIINLLSSSKTGLDPEVSPVLGILREMFVCWGRGFNAQFWYKFILCKFIISLKFARDGGGGGAIFHN